ncbi:MAG: carbonic anhydrase [Planctomycetota bacterium]|nr:carbonic anhydrase [Planctomycetota bacterium]
MVTASEALQRLREGNHRYVHDLSRSMLSTAARRRELLAGQHPFAIVLGCSDSRVPVETVFDQGLGDLFVVRVAGNVVSQSAVGSVEFAAGRFGTKLVVVMGHSMCGAIQSTLDGLTASTDDMSPDLASIVDRIRPVVEPLLATDLRADRKALVAEAVRRNVRASASHLRQVLAHDGLVVVGAEYSLETGAVDFFDRA